MATSYRSLIFCALLGLALTTLAALSVHAQVLPQAAATPGSPQAEWVMLRNGTLLNAQVENAGERCKLTVPQGEIQIRVADVEFRGNSREAAAAFRRERIEATDEPARLEYVEWCLRQDLPAAAKVELDLLGQQVPPSPRLPLLLRRWEQLRLLAHPSVPPSPVQNPTPSQAIASIAAEPIIASPLPASATRQPIAARIDPSVLPAQAQTSLPNNTPIAVNSEQLPTTLQMPKVEFRAVNPREPVSRLASSSAPISSAPPAAEIPSAAREAFARSTQVLLLNRCATAGCHGGQTTSWRLEKLARGTPLPQHLTLKNLAAATRFIDRESPEKSTLWIQATTPHGGAGIAPLTEKDDLARRNLWQWLSHFAPAPAQYPVAEAPASAVIPSLTAAPPPGNEIPPMKLDPALPASSTKGIPRVAATHSGQPNAAADPFDPAEFNRLGNERGNEAAAPPIPPPATIPTPTTIPTLEPPRKTLLR